MLKTNIDHRHTKYMKINPLFSTVTNSSNVSSNYELQQKSIILQLKIIYNTQFNYVCVYRCTRDISSTLASTHLTTTTIQNRSN